MYLESQEYPLTQPHDPGTVALTGELSAVLLLAAIVALPVSIGLLRRYRQAVIASMHERAKERMAGSLTPEASTLPEEPGQSVSDLQIIDRASSSMVGPSAAHLATLLRATWQAAVIYAVAGLC